MGGRGPAAPVQDPHLPLLWKSLSRHPAQLKKKKKEITKQAKVHSSVFYGIESWCGSGHAPSPCWACELTHLDEFYPFILDTADLRLWKQEAAI